MELWVQVVDRGGSARSLALDVQASHTIADLMDAVGQRLDEAIKRLWVQRTGESLNPSDAVSSTALRTGDVLLTAAPAGEPLGRASRTVRVVVAAGTDVGTDAPITTKGTIVGRSSRANLTIHDTTVSSRHASFTTDGDRVVVADLESSNGTYVNGVPITEPTTVAVGDIVEVGDVALRIAPADRQLPEFSTVDGRVQFTRGPRLQHVREATSFDLPAPPEQPQRRRWALSTALVPLAVAPIMVAVTHQVSYLAMAALSPIMAIAAVAEDRRHGRKDHSRQVADFRAAVTSADAGLASTIRDETSNRWACYPDVPEIVRRATGPTAELWERRRTDADALELRVGWGDLPSTARWSMRDGGDPTLRSEATDLLGRHGLVRSAPVTVSLAATPVIGVAGDAQNVDETAGWLIAQAATLHSPRELNLVVAIGEARVDSWEWASWLPHCRRDGALPPSFAADPYAVGDAAATQLVTALNQLVADRRRSGNTRPSETTTSGPLLLAVIDADVQVPRAALADLLETGPRYGIRIVWLGHHADALPGETGTIITASDRTVSLTAVTGGSSVQAQRDQCPAELLQRVGLGLAGVRDAASRSGGQAELPSFVTLAELLGGQATAESVATNWSRPTDGLAAPIGIGSAGRFSIDLRNDGPHGLLGGTTGAGKSELLQTLVVSLAAHHPPSRLTFLLVDYKGGAAFKDCVRLPHVVGFVTDLSGHLVQRALTSLGAELHRRERLLASVGAKDLMEMERRAPHQAPASLLLVVDEFATLAKELPEFVDGVVNVAQRGRSLGIHLLLATQRPAGAINDNIRANTNLRIALRMNDESDSHDVVGVAAAAHLPRTLPGRTFVRRGAGEVIEVQVAYSGAHTSGELVTAGLVVRDLHHGQAVGAPVTTQAAPTSTPSGSTDLEQVVQAAVEAAQALELPPQPSPLLPPLPEHIGLDQLRDFGPDLGETSTSGVSIGLLDLPGQQEQLPYEIDLDATGSLLVLGASGSGKTTLLRTIAVALARRSSPTALNFYALDFASRALGALESLPHCGGVIGADDVDRVQRLFSLLERWSAERKQRFAEVGATSFTEYRGRAPAGRDLPRIVVLLDSYAGFSAVFEKIDYGQRLEQLQQLVSEGRPLGINFVITATRRNAMPTALAASIASTIVLRLADADDYGAAGLDSRTVKAAALPPGRGFVGPSTTELQCAYVGDGPAGDAQSAAIVTEGAALSKVHGSMRAQRVESLPASLPLAPIRPLSRRLRPIVGIGERELAPLALDLTDGHALVVGPMRSGKSTALAAIATGLRQADGELELILLAPRRSPLTSLDIWSAMAKGVEKVELASEELRDRLAQRPDGAPDVVIVLDDGHEVVEGPASDALESIARRGRDTNVRLVVAIDAATAQRAYAGWVTELRRERCGLLLQPDPDADGDLFGVRLPRSRTTLPGRGYLIATNGAEVLQVAAD